MKWKPWDKKTLVWGERWRWKLCIAKAKRKKPIWSSKLPYIKWLKKKANISQPPSTPTPFIPLPLTKISVTTPSSMTSLRPLPSQAVGNFHLRAIRWRDRSWWACKDLCHPGQTLLDRRRRHVQSLPYHLQGTDPKVNHILAPLLHQLLRHPIHPICGQLMSSYLCPYLMFIFEYLIEFVWLKSDLNDNCDN